MESSTFLACDTVSVTTPSFIPFADLLPCWAIGRGLLCPSYKPPVLASIIWSQGSSTVVESHTGGKDRDWG